MTSSRPPAQQNAEGALLDLLPPSECAAISSPKFPKRFSEGFTERIDLIIRIVFMVVVAVGCYLVLEPFLTAILIAAVLAVVTWPVFNKLRSGMRQSSTSNT